MSRRYQDVIASMNPPSNADQAHQLLDELQRAGEADAERRRQEEPEGEPDGEAQEQDSEGQAERDRMEAYEAARRARGYRAEPHQDAEVAAVLGRRRPAYYR